MAIQTTLRGAKIFYEDQGKGAPLLFVHGYPLSRGAWRKQLDALKDSYRVIVPDLRGHGQSDATPGPVTMEDVAQDLHELLVQLKTGPVILIAHSMGGYAAFAFARLFPKMLKGLVLVGTRAVADSPEGAAARRATAEKVQKDGVDFVLDAMAPKMLAPRNQSPKAVATVRGLMASSTKQGIAGALLGMAERPDSTPLLAKISVPTLVVTGEEDALIPASESVKMAQAIPGAQLEIIPQAGHLVAFEKPEEFNRVLVEWLEGRRQPKPIPKPVKVLNVTPVFLVDDVVKTAEYYRDKFGFQFDRFYGEPPCFVMLALGPAEIFLSGPEEPGRKVMRPNGKTTGCWDAYIRVSDVMPLCESFRDRGVKIVRGPEVAFYQMKEFEVEDINGFRLCFGSDETGG